MPEAGTGREGLFRRANRGLGPRPGGRIIGGNPPQRTAIKTAAYGFALLAADGRIVEGCNLLFLNGAEGRTRTDM